MKKKLTFILTFALIMLCIPFGAMAESVDTPLLDEAKLITFGDSLTALSHWPNDTAKELNMYLVNSGIGGNTTDDAVARFERDVTSKMTNDKTNFVVIAFGTNDFYCDTANNPKVSLAKFEENLLFIIRNVRTLNAVPILLTTSYVQGTYPSYNPSNYDNDVNAALNKYNDVTRKVAADENVDLVDIWELCQDQPKSSYLISDGVHLAALGNSVYTDALVNYMKAHFKQDPTAPRVPEDVLPTVTTGTVTQSIISFDPNHWITPCTNAVIFSNDIDGNLLIANTTGLWPDAHYSPLCSEWLCVPVEGTVLTYDFTTKSSQARFDLYFAGSTPTGNYTDNYLYFDNYIKGAKVNSVGDLEANQTLRGSIKLSELPIPTSAIDKDGNVIISGMNVFVVGQANSPVVIRKFEVTSNYTEGEGVSCAIGKTAVNFENKDISLPVVLTDTATEITSIENGNTALTENTDYTFDGTTLSFKKYYLSTLPDGDTTLTITYNDSISSTNILTVTVPESQSSDIENASSISSTSTVNASDDSSDTNPANDYLGLYIAAAVVVILLVSVLLFIKRKK